MGTLWYLFKNIYLKEKALSGNQTLGMLFIAKGESDTKFRWHDIMTKEVLKLILAFGGKIKIERAPWALVHSVRQVTTQVTTLLVVCEEKFFLSKPKLSKVSLWFPKTIDFWLFDWSFWRLWVWFISLEEIWKRSERSASLRPSVKSWGNHSCCCQLWRHL